MRTFWMQMVVLTAAASPRGRLSEIRLLNILAPSTDGDIPSAAFISMTQILIVLVCSEIIAELYKT